MPRIDALSSHPLDDVASLCSLDGDADEGLLVQLGAGACDAAARVTTRGGRSHTTKSAGDSAAAAALPLPPPNRPVKWATKLADRATAAVELEAHYQVPPHMLFDLLADPSSHAAIFDAILAADAELLETTGPLKKFKLNYTARWKFWKVSGVCENRLFMWTDSDAGTVMFKLREPGFLNKYEGTWTIKAGCGAPLSAFNTPNGSPAQSSHDLSCSSRTSSIASSSSSSGSGSLSGVSSRTSSFTSVAANWSDSAVSIDSFTGGGSSSIGGSSSSSAKAAPLASVSATAAASLPLRVSASLASSAATTLARVQSVLYGGVGSSSSSSASAPTPQAAGSSIAGTICSWFSTTGGVPAHKPWTAVDTAFSPASLRLDSGSGRTGGGASQGMVRPLPTSCIITASTLTSPKLTPPYPLNQALKVQSKGQMKDMLDGLVRAAAAKMSSETGLNGQPLRLTGA